MRLIFSRSLSRLSFFFLLILNLISNSMQSVEMRDWLDWLALKQTHTYITHKQTNNNNNIIIMMIIITVDIITFTILVDRLPNTMDTCGERIYTHFLSFHFFFQPSSLWRSFPRTIECVSIFNTKFSFSRTIVAFCAALISGWSNYFVMCCC